MDNIIAADVSKDVHIDIEPIEQKSDHKSEPELNVPIVELNKRVIAFVNVQDFWVQVVRHISPKLRKKPFVVVTSNFPDAKILGVSSKARHYGATDGMSPEEARRVSPKIQFWFEWKEANEKNYFINLSNEIITAINDLNVPIEKCAIDEFYIDLTDLMTDTKYDCKDIRRIRAEVIDDHKRPLMKTPLKKSYWAQAAAILKYRVLNKILSATGFECWAGLSFNKQMARSAFFLEMTNQIVIVESNRGVDRLLKKWPLNKYHGYQGKLGREISMAVVAKIEWLWFWWPTWYRHCTLHELSQMSLDFLTKRFGKREAQKLWNLSRGIDHSPVRCECQMK